MASAFTRVLLVGNDPSRLRSQCNAYATGGSQAVISHPTELETHIGRERFDLVVLCPTLSETERCHVRQNASRRWPGVEVFQLGNSLLDFRAPNPPQQF